MKGGHDVRWKNFVVEEVVADGERGGGGRVSLGCGTLGGKKSSSCSREDGVGIVRYSFFSFWWRIMGEFI